VGLARSYGRLLAEEGVLMSAVAPNVVRTNITKGTFYDTLEGLGLLTPMEGVMSAFEAILDGDESGIVYECGPRGGWTKREVAEYLDKETTTLCGMLDEAKRSLHHRPEQ
jgi:NAD(P)-dependent dehydrogenase (short-subunit alcohol dehydrogenase family)